MTFSNQKIAGAILFAASVGFIMAMNIAEWLYPGYSASQNTISDLGVRYPSSVIFNTSVIIFGLLVIAGSYFLDRAYKKRIFSVFLILSGIGAIGVGIFPETTGNIHLAVASIAFTFGGLAAITSIQISKRPFNHFSIILGLIALTSLVLYSSQINLGLGHGGMERMIAYPELLWGAGLGGYMLSSQDYSKSWTSPAEKP